MAVSIAVPGRGRDERLPEVTVMDPCCIQGAASHTTEVSPPEAFIDDAMQIGQVIGGVIAALGKA
jgi:hypothetical protein